MSEIACELKSEVKPKAARMRHLLPQIEQALARGNSHVQVHAYLVTRGLDMTLPYFQNMLHRLRKERARGKLVNQTSPTWPMAQNSSSASREYSGTSPAVDSDVGFKWDVSSPLKW